MCCCQSPCWLQCYARDRPSACKPSPKAKAITRSSSRSENLPRSFLGIARSIKRKCFRHKPVCSAIVVSRFYCSPPLSKHPRTSWHTERGKYNNSRTTRRWPLFNSTNWVALSYHKVSPRWGQMSYIAITHSRPGVTVAVLDSGIDTNHPDLSDGIVG